jgi:hypothetical protein
MEPSLAESIYIRSSIVLKNIFKKGYEEIRDRKLLEILKKDRTWLKYELHCNVKTPAPLFFQNNLTFVIQMLASCYRFSCYYRFSDIAINSVNPSFIWRLEFSKNDILLFYLDVVWFDRWPEPWNFKTSHFRIIYSFPYRISALFLFHTKTDDTILLTTKVAR